MTAVFDARTLRHQDRAEMCGLFEAWIKQAEHGQLRLRIPHGARPVHNLRGMHYHYRPEIFLQIHGRTVFRFPREHFELGPGEICIVPAGTPHGEIVYPGADHGFLADYRPSYNEAAAKDAWARCLAWFKSHGV